MSTVGALPAAVCPASSLRFPCVNAPRRRSVPARVRTRTVFAHTNSRTQLLLQDSFARFGGAAGSNSMSAMADAPSMAASIAWMSDRSAAASSRTATRDLVAAAKEGDTAAFGILVDLYQQRVFRAATSLLGSESDARDAVQEVFLKAYRYFSKFDDSRELAPWLYKITTNVCRDMARSKRRHQGAPIEEQRLVSASPGPFERVARREQRHLTRLALARLPYKERAAITLRDLEGLATRDVARILGTTQATVRSQISSGRAKLRRSILGDARRKP